MTKFTFPYQEFVINSVGNDPFNQKILRHTKCPPILVSQRNRLAIFGKSTYRSMEKTSTRVASASNGSKCEPFPINELTKMDGSYALVSFDNGPYSPVQNVSTDRYGSYPIYISKDNLDNSYNAATQPGFLIPKSPFSQTLDVLGFFQWLMFGYIPSMRTLFYNVSRLPHASSICLCCGKQAKYWRLQDKNHPYMGDTKEQLLELSRLQDRAIGRHLETSYDREGILLSGGWDSRAMANRIKQGNPTLSMSAHSFGGPTAQDVCSASKVARDLGYSHSFTDYRIRNSLLGIEDWAVLHSDLTDNVFATLPEGPFQLRNLNFDRLWLGTDSFSTVLPITAPINQKSNYLGLTTHQIGLLSGAVASKIIGPLALIDLPFFISFSNDDLLAAFSEVVGMTDIGSDESFHSQFDRLSHATRFRVWNINRKILASNCPVVTPFHDVDLVEYYFSLPVQLRAQRRAHKLVNKPPTSVQNKIPFSSGTLAYDHIWEICTRSSLRRGVVSKILESDTISVFLLPEKFKAHFCQDQILARPDALLLLRFYMASVTFEGALSSSSPIKKEDNFHTFSPTQSKKAT